MTPGNIVGYKVAGAIPGKATVCLQLTYSFEPHDGPGIDWASKWVGSVAAQAISRLLLSERLEFEAGAVTHT
jgi:hypothetical protein